MFKGLKTLMLITVLATWVQATVLCVAPNTADCDMSICSSAHSTIQAAIDAASDSGDEIRVAEGTYTTTTDTTIANPYGDDFIFRQVAIIDTKSLSLRGGFSTANWSVQNYKNHPSIIDAGGDGRSLTIYGTYIQNVIIDGFTLQNGDYSNLGNSRLGPTISNWTCVRTGKDCGGGFWAKYVNLTLRNCIIKSNIASTTNTYSDGGGAYLWSTSSAVIDNVAFLNNTSDMYASGGGLSFYYGSDAVITNSMFDGNMVGNGAAISFFQMSGLASIIGSSFINNNAKNGGAIYLSMGYDAGEKLSLKQSLFRNNSAERGAVLFIRDAGSEAKSITMHNLIMHHNSSSSPSTALLEINSPRNSVNVDIKHVTAADNTANVASFLYVQESYRTGKELNITVKNTILKNFKDGVVAREQAGRGTVNIILDHILEHNVTNLFVSEEGTPTFVENGTLTVDPLLLADYHLQEGSPAINAGVATNVNVDFDGEKRPMGTAADIGADEFTEFTNILTPIIYFLLN